MNKSEFIEWFCQYSITYPIKYCSGLRSRMIWEKNFYRIQSHSRFQGLNFEFDIEKKVKLRFKVKAKIGVSSGDDFNRMALNLVLYGMVMVLQYFIETFVE